MNDRRNVDEDSTTDSHVITTTPSTPIVIEQPVDHQEGRSFSFGSFLLGVLATLIVGAIGIGVFLAVSDSDDDGNLQLDVPAVDVDVDN